MDKKYIYLLLILSAVLIVISFEMKAPEPGISILEIGGGQTITSNYLFQYENLDHPLLKQLREQEDLAAVVSPGQSELEKQILLMDWVHNLWPSQSRGDRPEPYCDALNILERMRRGDLPGGLCSEYTSIMMQASLSLGHQARILSIESKERQGHRVNEIWSNEYRKWIVIDPYYNIYFLKEGSPLNALELHRSLADGHSGEIRLMSPSGMAVDLQPEGIISLYHHLTVIMRNNHLSLRDGMINRFSLAFTDELTDGRPDFSKAVTGREEDLYWTLNQTTIEVLDMNPEKGLVVLKLTSNTPGQEKFEASLSGTDSWQEVSPVMEWNLAKGGNSLVLRSVNIRGVTGPPASIKVSYTVS